MLSSLCLSLHVNQNSAENFAFPAVSLKFLGFKGRTKIQTQGTVIESERENIDRGRTACITVEAKIHIGHGE